MKWMQENWLMVFTTWCIANTVLSSVATKVPISGFWGKLLHAFVAISPMDVMKAIKTVGASVTVPLACLCVVLLGCASTTALESYRTEEMACVSKANTKAEADLCRAAVETHYCGPGGALRDAGGCDQ